MAAMATSNKIPREDLTRKAITTCERYLPNDVLETILSRLPIKSILRFKAVSKAWNKVILDPRFARVHLHQFHYAYCNTNDDHHNLFMWPHYGTNRYLLAKVNGSELEVVSDLRFSDNKTPLSCSIVGSCDGFFLLYDQRETYVLWNPITGSKTSFPAYLGYSGCTQGICYDSLYDDYKVVYVTHKRYVVYSCRDRSWTESREFPYLITPTDPAAAGVTVRGVSYWVFSNLIIEKTYMRSVIKPTYEIVYFDTAECGLKTLHKPDKVQESDMIRLTSLNGRLCLYRKSHDYRHLQIWVLMHENNAWTKLTDVQDLPPLGDDFVHVKPLYLTEDHRIFLQFGSYYGAKKPSFIMYDIRNKTSERAWTTHDDERMHSDVVTGLGSLVLPTCKSHYLDRCFCLI